MASAPQQVTNITSLISLTIVYTTRFENNIPLNNTFFEILFTFFLSSISKDLFKKLLELLYNDNDFLWLDILNLLLIFDLYLI